jgi:integrase
VPRIRKLEEPAPRKGIVNDKQFGEIIANLPEWARPAIMAIAIMGWRVNAILSRRRGDVDEETGFLVLNRESSKNRTEYRWPLVGDMGDLVRAQLAQIQRDELKLGQVIPWLFHHNGKRIPYETLRNNWRRATRAAGYPGKLMHDFRRTAAPGWIQRRASRSRSR